MNLEALSEKFLRLYSLFETRQGEYISMNGTIPLTVGEIHLIAAIGNHPEKNITDLAKILGNTKGAVSQMAARLRKKNLLSKTHREDNDKEVILVLTREGQKIYEEHRKFHADLYEELKQYPSAIDGAATLLDIAEKYLIHYGKNP